MLKQDDVTMPLNKMESCWQLTGLYRGYLYIQLIFPDLQLVYTFVPILGMVVDIHLSEAPVTESRRVAGSVPSLRLENPRGQSHHENQLVHIAIWGCPKSWGCPNSWKNYFMENPINQHGWFRVPHILWNPHICYMHTPKKMAHHDWHNMFKKVTTRINKTIINCRLPSK